MTLTALILIVGQMANAAVSKAPTGFLSDLASRLAAAPVIATETAETRGAAEFESKVFGDHYFFRAAEVRELLSKAKTPLLKATLQAYLSFLGEKADPAIVNKLAAHSAFRTPLIRSFVFDYLKSGQIAKARELAINLKADLVTMGRIEYQSGRYVEAVKSYEKILKDSPDYLKTREELAWSYLQAGLFGKLRGVLPHIHEFVPMEYRLESRVLSSAVELEACNYPAVVNSLKLFKSEMVSLAKQADEKKGRSPVNSFLGDYLETARVDALGDKSAQRELDLFRDRERRQAWDNLEGQIREAINKIAFVRVELLNELFLLEKKQNKNFKGISSPVADLNLKMDKEILEEKAKDRVLFPVDKALWSDELFNVVSLTDGQCQEVKGVN